MLTISDNACTDALLDRVGLDAVNATAGRLGLGGTVIGSNLRELIDSLARDTGFADWAAFEGWADTEADPAALEAAQDRLRAPRRLQPDAPTRTTPRDMTRLLRLIWTDRGGSGRGVRAGALADGPSADPGPARPAASAPASAWRRRAAR